MQIQNALETHKQLIDDEAKNYPRPITACDVQFDYALEQQARIRRELRDAQALSADHVEREEFVRAVREFVVESAFLNAETAQQIKSLLADL